MKIKILINLTISFLFFAPTISYSDIFQKYCHVHWDGLKWKEGKKYFGDWKKVKVAKYNHQVAFFYMPHTVYKNLNCTEDEFFNINTECGKWSKGGLEVLLSTCDL